MIFPLWQIWIIGQCAPDAIGRSRTDSFSEWLTVSGTKSVCGAQRAGMRSRTRAFCVSANFSASGTMLSEYCPTPCCCFGSLIVTGFLQRCLTHIISKCSLIVFYCFFNRLLRMQCQPWHVKWIKHETHECASILNT